MQGTTVSGESQSVSALPRPMTLSEHLYEEILRLIISGEFAENTKLPTELELGERFAVSRTIVREALVKLKDDGLVVSRQGSGSFVRRRPDQAVLGFAPLGSISDMQRCFEFRALLEREAAYFAALRGDTGTIAVIEKALDQLEDAVHTGKLGVDADFEFHITIAQAAQNRFFVSTLVSLRTNISFGMNLTRSLSLARPLDRLKAVQAEHVAIFKAIRKRDPQQARDAMHQHIENARHRVFEGTTTQNYTAVSQDDT